MRIIDKLVWRIRLVHEGGAMKHWTMLLYGLLPQALRSERFFHYAVLRKIRSDALWKKLIRVREEGDFWVFGFSMMEIFYPKHATCIPLIDQYVEILFPYLGEEELIRKAVERLTLGRLREPYEYGGAVLKEGDVVLDAGANVGVFSIFAAGRVGRKGIIYAFEPMPEPRELLVRNLAHNKATCVEVVPYALGSESRQRDFFVGIFKASGSAYFTRGRKERVRVRQVSCDDFVAERAIANIDFIKVDIEGLEMEFLEGAQETIRAFRPRMAIAAYHREGDFDAIESALRKLVPEYRIERTSDKIFAWVE